jgi:hypothetical protein
VDNNSSIFELENDFLPEKILYTELCERLSELFINKEDLLNHTGKAIEMKFYSIIGIDKLELMETEKIYRELKFKTEIIQQFLNRNEIPDVSKINLLIQKELDNWQQVINLMKNNIAVSVQFFSNLISESDAKEIKKIYREIVKMLHPDLNPNLNIEQQQYWQFTLRAYKNNDLMTLKNIIFLLKSENFDNTANNNENIEQQIEAVRIQIEQIENEIISLKSKYPFTLLEHINNEIWIEWQIAEIRKQKEIYMNGIEHYKIRLNNLELIIENGQFSKN